MFVCLCCSEGNDCDGIDGEWRSKAVPDQLETHVCQSVSIHILLSIS